MKIFVGMDRRGVWRASLDESKLGRYSDVVFESDIETIHNNKIYLIHTYHGYDYDYDSTVKPIYDVNRYVFQAFHSILAAKKHKVWKEREELAKKNPEKYHVTNISIASDDNGEPFNYGDVMQHMFNMSIIGVKVI